MTHRSILSLTLVSLIVLATGCPKPGGTGGKGKTVKSDDPGGANASASQPIRLEPIGEVELKRGETKQHTITIIRAEGADQEVSFKVRPYGSGSPYAKGTPTSEIAAKVEAPDKISGTETTVTLSFTAPEDAQLGKKTFVLTTDFEGGGPLTSAFPVTVIDGE